MLLHGLEALNFLHGQEGQLLAHLVVKAFAGKGVIAAVVKQEDRDIPGLFHAAAAPIGVQPLLIFLAPAGEAEVRHAELILADELAGKLGPGVGVLHHQGLFPLPQAAQVFRSGPVAEIPPAHLGPQRIQTLEVQQVKVVVQGHEPQHIHPVELLVDLRQGRGSEAGRQLLAGDLLPQGQDLPALHVVQLRQLLLQGLEHHLLPAQGDPVAVRRHILGIPVVGLQGDGHRAELLLRHGLRPRGDPLQILQIQLILPLLDPPVAVRFQNLGAVRPIHALADLGQGLGVRLLHAGADGLQGLAQQGVHPGVDPLGKGRPRLDGVGAGVDPFRHGPQRREIHCVHVVRQRLQLLELPGPVGRVDGVQRLLTVSRGIVAGLNALGHFQQGGAVGLVQHGQQGGQIGLRLRRGRLPLVQRVQHGVDLVLQRIRGCGGGRLGSRNLRRVILSGAKRSRRIRSFVRRSRGGYGFFALLRMTVLGSLCLRRAATGRPYIFTLHYAFCILHFAFCTLHSPGGAQRRFQGRDAGVDQGQMQLLRGDLAAVQQADALGVGDGQGGEAVLSRGEALEILRLGNDLLGRQIPIRRGQAEEPGRAGADRPDPGLGKAPLPQEGPGAVHSSPEGAGTVGLVQGKEDLQPGLGGQLVQQGDLGGSVQTGGVQDAEPQVLRAAQVAGQGGQKRPPSRTGDGEGQF